MSGPAGAVYAVYGAFAGVMSCGNGKSLEEEKESMRGIAHEEIDNTFFENAKREFVYIGKAMKPFEEDESLYENSVLLDGMAERAHSVFCKASDVNPQGALIYLETYIILAVLYAFQIDVAITEDMCQATMIVFKTGTDAAIRRYEEWRKKWEPSVLDRVVSCSFESYRIVSHGNRRCGCYYQPKCTLGAGYAVLTESYGKMKEYYDWVMYHTKLGDLGNEANCCKSEEDAVKYALLEPLRNVWKDRYESWKSETLKMYEKVKKIKSDGFEKWEASCSVNALTTCVGQDLTEISTNFITHIDGLLRNPDNPESQYKGFEAKVLYFASALEIDNFHDLDEDYEEIRQLTGEKYKTLPNGESQAETFDYVKRHVHTFANRLHHFDITPINDVSLMRETAIGGCSISNHTCKLQELLAETMELHGKIQRGYPLTMKLSMQLAPLASTTRALLIASAKDKAKCCANAKSFLENAKE